MRVLSFASLAAVSLSSHAALAWEFTSGAPCVLMHETANITVELTYDPTVSVYSFSLTQKHSFLSAQVFSLQFSGGMPLAISTDRHRIINMKRTVNVTDSGFGNVLNGLQFNHTLTATLGQQSIEIPLANSASKVAAFRDCNIMPAV